MTTIYLIRHAEAEGNLYRIAQGQDNSSLTERGWRQVRALERRFADVRVDAVYTSDLYRACATASAVYKPKGLEPHRLAALREICVGEWERRTWGEIYRLWPEQMEHFIHRPHLWDIPGAEPLVQAQARVLEAIRAVAAENDGKTAAVFSHGYVIRLTLAGLQGYSMEQVGKTPTGDNTAVSLLEAEGNSLRMVFRDDNTHLKTPEYLAEEPVARRASGLEPGLWFHPLRLPEQAEEFSKLVAGSWQDERPFVEEKLLADAVRRETLVGYLGEETVGVLQVGPSPGWIALACIRKDCRKRGFGIQLIGQAVQIARGQKAQALSVALPENSAVRRFFSGCGFVPAGTTGDGRLVLEKDIRFDPAFMGHR